MLKYSRGIVGKLISGALSTKFNEGDVLEIKGLGFVQFKITDKYGGYTLSIGDKESDFDERYSSLNLLHKVKLYYENDQGNGVLFYNRLVEDVYLEYDKFWEVEYGEDLIDSYLDKLFFFKAHYIEV